MGRRERLVTDNQVLKSLKINKLRGIKDLEISFESKFYNWNFQIEW